MTHDELIAKMDDIDVAISNGFGKASVFLACVKATRSVIELHLQSDEVCSACPTYNYPCPTIQAIEKELE